MANAGDSYIVELKEAHLNWGTHRHTNSRGRVYGEGYIKIPSTAAYDYNIYNSNHSMTGLGFNLFNCTSSDGFFSGVLKAGGTQHDNIYAKQLHGDGDLQVLGSWFGHCNAVAGDHIEVTWVSHTDIIIRHF